MWPKSALEVILGEIKGNIYIFCFSGRTSSGSLSTAVDMRSAEHCEGIVSLPQSSGQNVNVSFIETLV